MHTICALILIVCISKNIVLANDRPIIGFLAQSVNPDKPSPGNVKLQQSYSQYIEMAGARSVVILTNQTESYYEKIFQRINGVLFPGGGVSISDSPMEKAARQLFNLAVRANNIGDYFPIWGTCLGFELLTFLATNEYVLVNCSAENISLPLMLEDVRESKLFYGMSQNVKNILVKENVTANFHRKCLSSSVFQKNFALKKFFRPISYNYDKNSLAFISTMEAINYPFYAVQWHPEKIITEFNPRKNVNHGYEAVQVAQYFSNFFVNEARKSTHKFPTLKEEQDSLLYSTPPFYYQQAGWLEKVYFFNVSDAPV